MKGLVFVNMILFQKSNPGTGQNTGVFNNYVVNLEVVGGSAVAEFVSDEVLVLIGVSGPSV